MTVNRSDKSDNSKIDESIRKRYIPKKIEHSGRTYTVILEKNHKLHKLRLLTVQVLNKILGPEKGTSIKEKLSKPKQVEHKLSKESVLSLKKLSDFKISQKALTELYKDDPRVKKIIPRRILAGEHLYDQLVRKAWELKGSDDQKNLTKVRQVLDEFEKRLFTTPEEATNYNFKISQKALTELYKDDPRVKKIIPRRILAGEHLYDQLVSKAWEFKGSDDQKNLTKVSEVLDEFEKRLFTTPEEATNYRISLLTNKSNFAVLGRNSDAIGRAMENQEIVQEFDQLRQFLQGSSTYLEKDREIYEFNEKLYKIIQPPKKGVERDLLVDVLIYMMAKEYPSWKKTIEVLVDESVKSTIGIEYALRENPDNKDLKLLKDKISGEAASRLVSLEQAIADYSKIADLSAKIGRWD